MPPYHLLGEVRVRGVLEGVGEVRVRGVLRGVRGGVGPRWMPPYHLYSEYSIQ
jgi:hypothetical protein